MIWKVPEIIAYLSRYFDLAAGDVILTGTPAGVGPVARGDRLEARIAGLEPLVRPRRLSRGAALARARRLATGVLLALVAVFLATLLVGRARRRPSG